MLSKQPPWLDSILKDSSPPPRLYAWGLDNLPTNEAIQSHPVRNAIDEHRRIHVLGLGNLGRLFASSLINSNNPAPVTLVVHRRDLLEQWLHSHGIEIARAGEATTRNKNFNIEWWTESPPTHGPVREVASGNKINNLIVATKASAALPSVDLLRYYLNGDSTVAFVQNGMSKLWPPYGSTYASYRYSDKDMPNYLSCVVTHGVFSQGPFSSVHASKATAVVGPVLVNPVSSDSSNYLMQQIAGAPDLSATIVSRIDLWVRQLEKIVVNSVINPLTAILRVRNGALFIDPYPGIAQITDRLLNEASQVLLALVEHESSDSILDVPSSSGTDGSSGNTSTIREQLTQRFSQPQLANMLHQVGIAVKDNKSSMLQDAEAGRVTEIQDFNGWFTDMAAFLNADLDVSTHHKLIQLVDSQAILSPEELSRKLLG
ncbi:2-dehydropantoate 2-reductase [Paramyrothecium foliicola]|nr:2-dehydropantoate 2-reductase [Paramyrothecium foliicola]